MPLALLFISLLVFAPDSTEMVRVRIGSSHTIKEVSFSVDSGALTLVDIQTGDRLARLGPGQSLRADLREDAIRFRWRGGGAIVERVRLESSETPLVVTLAAWDSPRIYRGTLDVVSADRSGSRQIFLINEINVEDYISSVIPAEYPFRELEGTKAQAVVARTYALRAASRSGESYDLVDTISSQVYPGASSETDVSRRAAFETAGEVLIFEDDLIEAVYSASNGGHTAANTTVWIGDPAPYLASRPDSFDRGSLHDSWEVRIRKSRLHTMLGNAGHNGANRLEIAETSSEGRVLSLRFGRSSRQTLRGPELRTVVNRSLGENTLKSTWFELSESGNDYVFSGRGFGHGVGLSQIGTQQRAQGGHSYDEILAFYYRGTELTDLGTTWTEPPPVAATVADADDDRDYDVETRPERERTPVSARPRTIAPPKVWHNREGNRRIGW